MARTLFDTIAAGERHCFKGVGAADIFNLWLNQQIAFSVDAMTSNVLSELYPIYLRSIDMLAASGDRIPQHVRTLLKETLPPTPVFTQSDIDDAKIINESKNAFSRKAMKKGGITLGPVIVLSDVEYSALTDAVNRNVHKSELIQVGASNRYSTAILKLMHELVHFNQYAVNGRQTFTTNYLLKNAPFVTKGYGFDPFEQQAYLYERFIVEYLGGAFCRANKRNVDDHIKEFLSGSRAVDCKDPNAPTGDGSQDNGGGRPPLPSPLPDLTGTITHSPSNPTTANVVIVRITVTNKGEVAAGPSILELRIANKAEWIAVLPLRPGMKQEWTREVAFELGGQYSLVATANADKSIVESNDSNNKALDNVFVAKGGGPADLIPRIAYSPHGPRPRQNVQTTVVVENAGAGAARASKLSLRTPNDVLIVDVPVLSAGGRFSLQHSVAAPDLEPYLLTTTADSSQVVQEKNETNNVATATIQAVLRRSNLLSIGAGPAGPYISYERLITSWLAGRLGVGYWPAVTTHIHSRGRPASLTFLAGASYVTPEFAGLSLEAGLGTLLSAKVGSSSGAGTVEDSDPRDALSSPLGLAGTGTVGPRFAWGLSIWRIQYAPIWGNGVFRNWVDLSVGLEFGR